MPSNMSPRALTLAIAVALGAAVLSPSTALGQGELLGSPGRLTRGGMDLHLFRPAVDSKGLLVTNGADVLGHLSFSFGLIVDGGFGLLPFTGYTRDDRMGSNIDYCGFRDPSVGLCSRMVDYLFYGTLHANLGLFNILEVGFQLPLGVFGAGPNVVVPDGGGATGFNGESVRSSTPLNDHRALTYQGIGNLSLHVKGRFFRATPRTSNFGLAAILQVEFPTSTGSGGSGSSAFVGDNTVGLWPIVALEWRPDRLVRLGLNVGTRLMFGETPTWRVGGRTVPTDVASNQFDPVLDVNQPGTLVHYGPMLTYSLGAGFHFGDSPLELTFDIYGASIYEAIGQTGGNSLEAMAGLKIFVDPHSYLVFGGGGGLPINGLLQSDIRGMVAFIFEPSIGDRDGDGIRDDDDACPDEAEDMDDFDDEDGCPEEDNDRDGIPDADDQCPNIPEDRDGEQDEDGCPDSDDRDRDGDGIPDSDDQCPEQPEDRDQFEDDDGCPDPDNDQDGLPDQDDLCPNEAEDFDDFEDQNGCPEPDNDHDRILDQDDECPMDPETYNGTDDQDGCPDRGMVVIEENSIVILEKIYFETDSAEIQERSFPILDAVAATLVGNPHITLLEIQGHADEQGSDQYNIRLTSDRANAVLEALVSRGVERHRVRAAGYGERCPINPAHNATAWEENRRVEFKILETLDGPTGVEIACEAGRELIPR